MVGVVDVCQTGCDFIDERGMLRFLFGIITVFDVAAVHTVVRRVAVQLHCCLLYFISVCPKLFTFFAMEHVSLQL